VAEGAAVITKFVVGDELLDAFVAAGVFDNAELKNIRRIVIDLRVGEAAVMYLEEYLDRDAMHEVIASGGVRIVATSDQAGRTGMRPRP
jgi:hypothetical protein